MVHTDMFSSIAGALMIEMDNVQKDTTSKDVHDTKDRDDVQETNMSQIVLNLIIHNTDRLVCGAVHKGLCNHHFIGQFSPLLCYQC